MAAEIGVAAALFYKSADLGPERSFSYPFLDAIEDLKANFIEVENLSKSYIFIQSSLVNYLKPFLAVRLSFFDNLLEKKGAIWMGCKWSGSDCICYWWIEKWFFDRVKHLFTTLSALLNVSKKKCNWVTLLFISISKASMHMSEEGAQLLDVICAHLMQTGVERVSKAKIIFEWSIKKRDMSRTMSCLAPIHRPRPSRSRTRRNWGTIKKCHCASSEASSSFRTKGGVPIGAR